MVDLFLTVVWLLTAFSVFRILITFDPNQTVTDLSYDNFSKAEYPCLVFAFYDHDNRKFIQQPSNGIYFLDILSGKAIDNDTF